MRCEEGHRCRGLVLQAGDEVAELGAVGTVRLGEQVRPGGVAALHAEVPVHAGARLVEEGLGREAGQEAMLRRDLACQALEAVHRIGLSQRWARVEVDLELR